MPQLYRDHSLKPLNTFGIAAKCLFFCEIHQVSDFEELVKTPEYKENKRLILGGGSNLLLTGDFQGLVVRNCLKGIEVVREEGDSVWVKAAAGEVWHDLVGWCIARAYGGLENLSLIPGCVGASPMQNIGAYGVEIKEVFEELEAYSTADASKRTFDKAACKFGYRESVFKRECKDQFLIAYVTFRLSKKPALNTSYGAIREELSNMKVSAPGIAEVAQAVINIRRSKLPDPAVLGNAGSFFKNPEVEEETYKRLKAAYENLVAYPLERGRFKLAAGWLIEQCGLKGMERNGAAVHEKQALVLVNKKGCKGSDILELSEFVIERVKEKFGVQLEREVNIV